MVNSNDIARVFESILDDESVLDDIDFKVLEDVHQQIYFYIIDRDDVASELDFE